MSKEIKNLETKNLESSKKSLGSSKKSKILQSTTSPVSVTNSPLLGLLEEEQELVHSQQKMEQERAPMLHQPITWEQYLNRMAEAIVQSQKETQELRNVITQLVMPQVTQIANSGQNGGSSSTLSVVPTLTVSKPTPIIGISVLDNPTPKEGWERKFLTTLSPEVRQNPREMAKELEREKQRRMDLKVDKEQVLSAMSLEIDVLLESGDPANVAKARRLFQEQQDIARIAAVQGWSAVDKLMDQDPKTLELNKRFVASYKDRVGKSPEEDKLELRIKLLEKSLKQQQLNTSKQGKSTSDKSSRRRDRQKDSGKSGKKEKNLKCYNCGKKGHIAKECTAPKVDRSEKGGRDRKGRGAGKGDKAPAASVPK